MNPFLVKALATFAIGMALVSWGMLERAGKLAAQAQIRQLTIDVDELGKKIKDCNAAVDNWKQSVEDAQKDALEARQRAQAEAKKHQAERTSIQAALKAPTPSKAGCEAAWDLIEKGPAR